MIYIYSFLQKVKSQYKNSEKVTVAILDENDDKDHRKDLSVEIRTVETVHHLLKREKKKKKRKRKRAITQAYLENNYYFFICLCYCENSTAFQVFSIIFLSIKALVKKCLFTI